MTRSTAGKAGLLAVFVAAIAAYFVFDLGAYLTLDNLKARRADLAMLLEDRPLAIIGAFFLLYVATTALSLPGAAILTLAAGAIFGLWLGTLIVSFASAIGANIAFLSARFVLRDWVMARFSGCASVTEKGDASAPALFAITSFPLPARAGCSGRASVRERP